MLKLAKSWARSWAGSWARPWARRALRRYEQMRNAAQAKSESRHVSKSEITAGLSALGLKSGDVVMLHSSLRSVGYVPGGATVIIEAILDTIGPLGTLIVPTYYQPGGSILAACHAEGYVFDTRIHGTVLGALPSAFLKFAGVERSVHPTHSVSALGPQAKYVTEFHHLAPSIFGVGSPWQRCVELRGKILGLGVTMGPITFYHLLEDTVLGKFPLPVRMPQTFMLSCKDWAGKSISVPVTPLDPKYASQRIDTPGRGDLREYFWREFEQAGLLTIGMVGEARSWCADAEPFYDHLNMLMEAGITIYSTPEELAERPLKFRAPESATREPESI